MLSERRSLALHHVNSPRDALKTAQNQETRRTDPWFALRCQRSCSQVWVILGYGLKVMPQIREVQCRIDGLRERMIPPASASGGERIAFRVVDFFQVSVLGTRFDSPLQENDFVIAGHDNDGWAQRNRVACRLRQTMRPFVGIPRC